MKPDESLFRSHLEEAPFQSGVDRAKWGLPSGLESVTWPHAVLWVAADERILPSRKIHLRFTLDGYSASAPTACPWDLEKGTVLENPLRPKLTGKFALVFRVDWNAGTALYAPCDRVAMTGHDAWQKQFPFWWWRADFTIVKYLEFVHMCLNPVRHEDP